MTGIVGALVAWIRDGKRRRAMAIAATLALFGAGLVVLGLMRPPPRPVAPTPAPLANPLPQIAPPPVVEPKIAAPLPADQARKTNAAVPFVTSAIPAAPPLAYVGTPQDRANAVTCLAAAAYYEAGDDRPGEEAVAQVVINRVRHPAFPKTVCGVVFQGAERTTGCQFTFACDGALARVPTPAAWTRARAIADSALAGHVDATVGTATHYHADYVVPYWHASLDKLAEVRGQIFYRWQGWWGSPRAFTGHIQPFERIDPRLVALAGPVPGAAFTGTAAEAAELFDNPHPPTASLQVPGVSGGALQGSVVRLMDVDANQFVLQLNPSARPPSYEAAARTICKARPDCIVMGWLQADHLPAQLPVLPPRMRTMAFLYRKSSIIGTTRAYWNCHQVPNADTGRCLPGTEP
jgi:spore germination cell wall hydrolase CwlJ-like protein